MGDEELSLEEEGISEDWLASLEEGVEETKEDSAEENSEEDCEDVAEEEEEDDEDEETSEEDASPLDSTLDSALDDCSPPPPQPQADKVKALNANKMDSFFFIGDPRFLLFLPF